MEIHLDQKKKNILTTKKLLKFNPSNFTSFNLLLAVRLSWL